MRPPSYWSNVSTSPTGRCQSGVHQGCYHLDVLIQAASARMRLGRKGSSCLELITHSRMPGVDNGQPCLQITAQIKSVRFPAGILFGHGHQRVPHARSARTGRGKNSKAACSCRVLDTHVRLFPKCNSNSGSATIVWTMEPFLVPTPADLLLPKFRDDHILCLNANLPGG
jgi:hypothetical protein